MRLRSGLCEVGSGKIEGNEGGNVVKDREMSGKLKNKEHILKVLNK